MPTSDLPAAATNPAGSQPMLGDSSGINMSNTFAASAGPPSPSWESVDPSLLLLMDDGGQDAADGYYYGQEWSLGAAASRVTSQDPSHSHVPPSGFHSGYSSPMSHPGRSSFLMDDELHRQMPPTPPPRAGLPRRRSRYLRRLPGQAGSSLPQPIAIPYAAASLMANDGAGSDAAALDPMQRWQESPPEAEAASLDAIAGALRHALPSFSSSENMSLHKRRGRMARRAHSSTSGNSGAASFSSRSTGSSRSTTSNNHHHHYQQQGGSRASRRRTTTTRTNMGGGKASPAARSTAASRDGRQFQCTFCCDSFRTKYDWARHETSLHLSLEKWVCTPHGGAVASPSTGRNHCAYCSMLDPTPEHLAGHNHDACSQTRSGSGSGAEPPVFARKDHLVQHLRLVHRVDTLPLIDEWRIAAPPIVCRCGFCGAALGSWQQRADHLAKHFREGRTMDEWQGDHGFEPAVAAQVTNAIPPYVLGVQRKTPIPFTATGSGTRDQMCQMRQFYRERQASLAGGDDAAAAAAAAAIGHGDSLSTWAAGAASSELLGTPATADGTADDIELNLDAGNPGVEWLALGLARFARFQMRSGVVPTDRMFQDEARRLFYGCEDGWEQTLADNPEWLSGFRMQHIDRRDGQGG